MLQGETELFLNKEFNMKAYKIVITQQTRNYAPGILISKDERGFTRYEGYLELFFF